MQYSKPIYNTDNTQHTDNADKGGLLEGTEQTIDEILQASDQEIDELLQKVDQEIDEILEGLQ